MQDPGTPMGGRSTKRKLRSEKGGLRGQSASPAGMALVGRLRRPSPDALFSYRRFITLPARSAIFLSERFTSAVWIGRSPPFCLMESPRRRWPNRAEKTGECTVGMAERKKRPMGRGRGAMPAASET